MDSFHSAFKISIIFILLFISIAAKGHYTINGKKDHYRWLCHLLLKKWGKGMNITKNMEEIKSWKVEVMWMWAHDWSSLSTTVHFLKIKSVHHIWNFCRCLLTSTTEYVAAGILGTDFQGERVMVWRCSQGGVSVVQCCRALSLSSYSQSPVLRRNTLNSIFEDVTQSFSLT